MVEFKAADLTPSPGSRRGRAASGGRSVVALTFLAAFVVASQPRAQVMQIGATGEVTIYDRPAVFTSEGAQPILARSPDPHPIRGPAPLSPSEVRRALGQAAAAHQLSPDLVEAVAWRESGLRAAATSRAGARGVMQLMPGTARDLGVDASDPRQNIGGGAAYLKAMLSRFGGDLSLGLAAYNAGPGAVMRYRGVPPYAETRRYVAAVMERMAAQAAAPDR